MGRRERVRLCGAAIAGEAKFPFSQFRFRLVEMFGRESRVRDLLSKARKKHVHHLLDEMMLLPVVIAASLGGTTDERDQTLTSLGLKGGFEANDGVI